MFFRWLKGETDGVAEHVDASDELKQLVRRSMPDSSADSVAIVGAVAGLLAFTAYADRAYRDEERAAVEQALERLDELPAHAAQAISSLLSSRIAELANEPLTSYTRVLFELTSRAARNELFDVLMDVAAADDVLSMDETLGLRRVAKLLGLGDEDYAAAQARHRTRLSVLR
jgi:uncharacterized tellurite resistance protein B-like protein